LSVSFISRSKAGKIHVTYQPNTDDEHAAGLDLIFPSIPPSSFRKQFHGFPVMQATVEYPIPAPALSSYACLFGWIQFIQVTPIQDSGEYGKPGDWEMDVYPWAKDLKSPFCFWGHNPTAFDAPARLVAEGGEFETCVWRAQSYLCVLDDAGMSKKVRAIKDAGFGWGFDITSVHGEVGKKRRLIVKGVKALEQEKEWKGRLMLLRKEYPDFMFSDDFAH
jgi:hypothetical protein